MGKRLNQQRRGKGGPVFRAPSHLYLADVNFRTYDEAERTGCLKGKVIDLMDDPSRSAILMEVKCEDGKNYLLIAPEGIAVGEEICFGKNADIKIGNVLPLGEIPDGVPIYNIELIPGDGGKLVRSAGNVAYIISHVGEKVWVSLPSKEVKILDKNCRAQIGVVSCGGIKEKPIFKAGKAYHIYKPTAKYWPITRGVAMSAYDHPFGGKEHHAGKSTIVSKGAPPGQKVGLVGAGKVGRRKGKKKVTEEQI